MRHFKNINYIIGVILTFIGFILYNYEMSNDLEIITASFLIGLGVVFLLGSYI